MAQSATDKNTQSPSTPPMYPRGASPAEIGAGIRGKVRVLDIGMQPSGLAAKIIADGAQAMTCIIGPKTFNAAAGQHTLRAQAQALPYASGSFDHVMLPYTLQRIPQREALLRELYRVARPGAQIIIVDIAAPEDPQTAQRYNKLEILRRPTQPPALSFTALRTLTKEAGFMLESSRISQLPEQTISQWLAREQPPAAAQKQIMQLLEEEIHTGIESGLRPTWRAGQLRITLAVATLIINRPRP